MRWYLPSTSFIGYFRRCECSVMPCSRTEAPLAQCAPRFSGESNTGSCRTHTPFFTTASTAQPTEQCVHTVRRDLFARGRRRRRRRRLGLADGTVRKLRRERGGTGSHAGALQERASIDRPAVHAGNGTRKATLGRRGPRGFLRKHRGVSRLDLGGAVVMPDVRGFAITGLRRVLGCRAVDAALRSPTIVVATAAAAAAPPIATALKKPRRLGCSLFI